MFACQLSQYRVLQVHFTTTILASFPGLVREFCTVSNERACLVPRPHPLMRNGEDVSSTNFLTNHMWQSHIEIEDYAVSLNFCYGWGSYALRRLIR